MPALLCCSYKTFHHQMYPKGMTKLYSNFTPRSYKYMKCEESVFFGLQYYIKEYLIKRWNEDFFHKELDDVIDEYKRFHKNFSGVDIDVSHIVKLHNLGYLPIHIKALDEGTLVPENVPVLTITNTHEDFGWLVNFLESQMSTVLWDYMCVATVSHMYRKIVDKYAKISGDENFVYWQCHDFSQRGKTSNESVYCQAGHLLSFTGTDTIPSVLFLEEYYNANMENELIAASVPATEHSVTTSNILHEMKKQNVDMTKAEEITISKMLDVFPTGLLSYVSDSFDYYNVLDTVLPALKDKIMARDGKLVIRGDSGDPVEIICGIEIDEYFKEEDVEYYLLDEIENNTPHGKRGDDIEKVVKLNGSYFKAKVCAKWNRYDKQYYYIDGSKLTLEPYELTSADKGTVELLWETFGGFVNEKGYKVLDSHIGAIYGEAITKERCEEICRRLIKKGFASTNVVMGIGSYSFVNSRDALGLAMKATYCEVDGEPVEIYKDPATDDGSKKSLKGLLKVYQEEGVLKVKDQCTKEEEEEGLLISKFKDGKILVEHSLAEVRGRKLLSGG